MSDKSKSWISIVKKIDKKLGDDWESDEWECKGFQCYGCLLKGILIFLAVCITLGAGVAAAVWVFRAITGI